ncbi:pentapeptide repeat-containing protein [candidate division KSB1 bacterium]|nr:pentapeptide repeat-containing protein [candidate division KSB1 bacterium]
MPDQEHLKILKQGVNIWNEWKSKNSDIHPNLSEVDLISAVLTKIDFSNVDLHGACLVGSDLNSAKLENALLRKTNLSIANLKGANLKNASLSEVNLNGANLNAADLSFADLNNASLKGTDLSEVDLSNADLRGANLTNAILTKANLSGANLENAILNGADMNSADLSNSNLSTASLIGSDLSNADISNANIFGISASELTLDNTIQKSLQINQGNDLLIQVDNFDVSQLINLLLNNRNIHSVIESITSNIVIILGRFSEDRKDVLDAIRDELRSHNYLPVLIGLNGSANKEITEKIATLARISKFIIADITGSTSVTKELQKIVKNIPWVPVQPLVQDNGIEYGEIFESKQDYPWISPIFHYKNIDSLLPSISDHIIAPTVSLLSKLNKN